MGTKTVVPRTPLVLFDYQIFSSQSVGGISRYFHELSTHIAARKRFDARILAPVHVNEYLAKNRSRLVIGKRVPSLRRTGRARTLINETIWRAWSPRLMPAVVHETYYAATRPSNTRAPIVLTVYDMIHERYPNAFPPSDDTAERKAAAVQRADHIICISESTKRDLVDILDVDPHRTSVVHLGSSFSSHNKPAPTLATWPYILYVGRRGSYKNFDRVVEAVSVLSETVEDVRIIAFGGGPLTASEKDLALRSGLSPDRIVHVDGDDALLHSLYSGASVFVYPSLYEGFGIPPLEAMALGCPVACSNTSSLPEVVGDAAELFDPTDVASIAAALQRVLVSQERASTLVRRGAERARLFSWERCARETELVYRELIQQ